MRLYQILLFVLVLSIVLSEASARRRRQRGRCKGKPARESCTAGMNAGNRRGRRCRPNANNAMWYYDAARNRTCLPLKYQGCGGNGNRFCTRQACEARCRR